MTAEISTDPWATLDDLLGIQVDETVDHGRVISTRLAHQPLISDTDFLTTQAINATLHPADGTHRRYLLAGLLRCAHCQRRLHSHWIHQRPGYRCRHGHTSSTPHTPHAARTLYLREDTLLSRITTALHHHPSTQATLHSPTAILEHLTTHNLTITCTPNTIHLTQRPTTD